MRIAINMGDHPRNWSCSIIGHEPLYSFVDAVSADDDLDILYDEFMERDCDEISAALRAFFGPSLLCIQGGGNA